MQDVSLPARPPWSAPPWASSGELFRAGDSRTHSEWPRPGTVLLGTGGPLARLAAAGVLRPRVARKGGERAGGAAEEPHVGALPIRAIAAAVYKQDSWYDGEPCIVLDYSKTSIVAHMVRDEIREIAPGVYLGLVFWGRRHVLDFALDFTAQRS